MKIKKLLTIIITTIILSLATAPSTYANSIENINIDAKIQNDGSLLITQIWNVNSTKGTEYYIPMQKINHMTVEDFTVTADNIKFNYVPNWDINWSFSQKAYKNSIRQLDEGIELNFGKSDYAIKNYTLNYKLQNAVQAFSDMDGFNIRFINDKMSPAPKSFTVTISKDGTTLSKDNAKIWGFGYDGEINFVDGKIIAKNNNLFTEDNHVTLLIGLNKGIVQPTYIGTGTFDDLKNTALEGSSFEKNYSILAKIKDYMACIILFLFFFINIIAKFIRNILSDKPRNITNSTYKNDGYYQELPADNSMLRIYYLLSYSKKHEVELPHLIAAQLLKWISKGHLGAKNISTEKGFVFKKNETTLNLEILSTPTFQFNFERDLWSIIVRAAGSNKALEPHEFKKLTKNHPELFEAFIDNLENEAFDKAEKSNDIISTKRTIGYTTNFTEQGLKEIKNIIGFKNFLKDFTLINSRSTKEVVLWDNYLILATMFKMGDTVLKEMKQLYPQYVFASTNIPEAKSWDMHSLFMTARLIGYAGNNGYTQTLNSTSSGGGGFSSLGGGGGFSGGGSGGGSR